MILRKLADAIHKQNWFTVVLEILIDQNLGVRAHAAESLP